jgi:hypothetical protein
LETPVRRSTAPAAGRDRRRNGCGAAQVSIVIDGVNDFPPTQTVIGADGSTWSLASAGPLADEPPTLFAKERLIAWAPVRRIQ